MTIEKVDLFLLSKLKEDPVRFYERVMKVLNDDEKGAFVECWQEWMGKEKSSV